MKRKWRSFVEDYLTFTRRDRISMLVILLLMVVLYFTPYLFRRKTEPLDVALINQELADLKIYIDSSKPQYARRDNDDDEYGHYTPAPFYKKEVLTKGELFVFDPNTLDAEGWKRLGVRERTIETIKKFVAKGYKFREAEDIKRIYGLKPAEAERLMPYIKIGDAVADEKIQTPFEKSEPFTAKTVAVSKPKIIDVNEADTSAFIALPGIGSKLAARIVTFKNKLGGFYSVNQIAETYALPDSVFQVNKSNMVCVNPQLRKIDINSADVNTLKAHPYLRWNLANAIINYRQQHGSYKKVEDLKKIDIITEDVFAKVAPYLSIGQ